VESQVTAPKIYGDLGGSLQGEEPRSIEAKGYDVRVKGVDFLLAKFLCHASRQVEP
jgi:hypothetical protein